MARTLTDMDTGDTSAASRGARLAQSSALVAHLKARDRHCAIALQRRAQAQFLYCFNSSGGLPWLDTVRAALLMEH